VYNKKITVVRNEEVAPGCRLLCLEAPEIAAGAAPGQFMHLLCAGGQDPILRRPLSIHYADRESGQVYILYRVAGKGTALLARRGPGELLEVMGPLGRGYTLPAPGERVAVLGGGIGVAPLLFLIREIKRLYRGETGGVSVFLGAPAGASLLGAGQVLELGLDLHLATDDGSVGFKGNVVDLFRHSSGTFDRVYACGPLPMLRALAGALSPGSRAEVSVEERMGCGVGACLSCACKVRSGPGAEWRYAHVCTDGPVFDLRELVLD